MAANGTYQIYVASASAPDLNDPTAWAFSGTSNNGSIGDAFGVAGAMQANDPDNMYTPYVQYEVYEWMQSLGANEPADPAITNNDPVISANLFSAVAGYNQRWQDYLASLPDGGNYSVNAVGPG